MEKFCCFKTSGSPSSDQRPTIAGKGKNRQSGVKISFGYSLVKGRTSHPMEDFHVSKFITLKGKELGLFAIFDGHSGDGVPSYLQKNLFNNILNEEGFWIAPETAISRAFDRTDQEILSHSSGLGLGGSTAVIAITVNGKKIWIANIGDSRGVLLKRGQAIQVTVDHEPIAERGRIEDSGGFVSNMPGDVPRVNGQLAVSRAFGDRLLKPHLSSVPAVLAEDITSDTSLLILASDGIWKVMNNQEAVDIARRVQDPQLAAKQLTDEALRRECKDDISCIIIRFKRSIRRGRKSSSVKMDDPELEAIRQRRMQELMARQGIGNQQNASQQKAQEDAKREADERRQLMLSQILSSQARERIARIALVKPEKARGVEDLVLRAAQMGQITEKVTEERLISLLEQINTQTAKQTKVTIQRRRNVLEDDD